MVLVAVLFINKNYIIDQKIVGREVFRLEQWHETGANNQWKRVLGFGEYGLREEAFLKFFSEFPHVRGRGYFLPLRVDHVVDEIVPEIVADFGLALDELGHVLELGPTCL